MANQLTSSGLTVGIGTANNIITTFGSNLVGARKLTVTPPSTDKSLPSSPALGVLYTYNFTKYVTSSDNNMPLPSGGKYCYAGNITGKSNKFPAASDNTIIRTVEITPNSVVAGGFNLNTSYLFDNTYVRVGGFVRVE